MANEDSKNTVVTVSSASTPIPLLKSETVIFKEHPAIVLTILYVLSVGILAGAIYWFVLAELHFFSISNLVIYFVIFLLIICGLALWLWSSTTYTLTTRRVQWKSGIFGQKAISIALENIENISLDLPFLGRFFNYGNVNIEPAGIFTEINFNAIKDPEKKQNLIEDNMP